MTRAARLCCLLVLAALTAPARGATNTTSLIETLVREAQPDEAWRGRVNTLVRDLGAVEFDTRERAARQLREIGRAARPWLERASVTKDPEVALRTARLLDLLSEDLRPMPPEVFEAVQAQLDAPPREAVDRLLALLEHVHPDARHWAVHGLRELTGRAFGFDARHPPGERHRAIARWEAWWAGSREGFEPPPREDWGILLNTYDKQRLRLLDRDGGLIWDWTLPGRTSYALGRPDGAVLVCALDDHSIKRYGPGRELDWIWRVPRATEGGVYGVQALPDGGLLLGIGYSAEFSVIDLGPDRAIRARLPSKDAEVVVSRAHRFPDGRVLIPSEYGHEVEVRDGLDGEVKARWELDSPRRVHGLVNGHTLTTHGFAVVELDVAGEERWRSECASQPFDCLRLPDGRTAILAEQEGLFLVGGGGDLPVVLFDEAFRYGSITLAPAALRKAQAEPKD